MSGGVLSGQSGGGIADGDKGDITVTGSGDNWTLDNGVVALAKMADIATARMIGRVTAGTGSPEALTGTQVTALLDTVTTSAKGLVPTAPNDTAKFLRGDGTWSALPTPANVTDGDKGDITVSTGTWTIDNGTVTLAKMANIATARILGRTTAGTGVPEVLTGTQATALLDTFSTTSTTKGLVPGSNNAGATKFLDGTGAWSTPAGSNALVTSNIIPKGNGTTQVASQITDDGTLVTINPIEAFTGVSGFNLKLGIQGTTTPSLLLRETTVNSEGGILMSGGTVYLGGFAGTTNTTIYAANSTAISIQSGTTTITTHLATQGTNTLGNDASDTTDINGDLTKFGSSNGDGDLFISTQGGPSSLNNGYANSSDGGETAINNRGYLDGTTKFRDLKIYDGKGAVVATFTGSTKAKDFTPGPTVVGAFGGKVQTTTATGTLNDFALAADTELLVVNSSSVIFTGLQGGWDGRIVWIVSVNNAVTLSHQSGSSTAGNRFHLPGASNWTQSGLTLFAIRYVGALSSWMLARDSQFPVLSVTGLATLTGGFATNNVATVNAGAASPTQTTLSIRNNSLTGGVVDFVPLGTDNDIVAFDANYASSAYTARSTSVGLIGKKSGKLLLGGFAGTTSGTTVTSNVAAAIASPPISIDLATGGVTLGFATNVVGASSFSNDANFNADLYANNNLYVANTANLTDVTVNGNGTNVALRIGRRMYTTPGAFTYTPTPGTRRVLIRLVGGGGYGKSATGDASGNLSIGAGGGAGGYIEKWIDPGTTIVGGSGQVGAGGVSSTSTTATFSSITINGTTYTASPGGVASTLTAGASTLYGQGGAGGTTSGNGDINITGESGSLMFRSTKTAAASGGGGSSPLGTGGAQSYLDGAGAAATGYGAGGGGAYSTSATTYQGGNGTQGVVIVDEYR